MVGTSTDDGMVRTEDGKLDVERGEIWVDQDQDLNCVFADH